MIADATVYKKQDEPWTLVLFGQYGDGSADVEYEFNNIAEAMRCAVRAGGTITLVVEP